MIIVLKKDYSKEQFNNLEKLITSERVKIEKIVGTNQTVLGLIGDTSKIDIDMIRSHEIVESVKRIQEPYKLANRKFHNEDTIIDINGVKIGGDNFTFIAGPCTIEGEKQIIEIAKNVKKSGAKILRGGAFKPRTSPYTFQGLKDEGLTYLLKAKEETGLAIISEIMSVRHIDLFDKVDIIQIGARDMQNYELLREVGKTKKPVLLKRGFCNTVEEWLMSAEYIMSEGANDVILCERGIRTFETLTRNTLDLSSLPLLKELTHLPVVVDPSHATGVARLVKPLSLSAVGAGADGLMIEVHTNPEKALCDGVQSILPKQFDDIVKSVNEMLNICGKKKIFE